ncbi:MAG: AAA family ATPase [Thermofilum sp.]
MGRSREKILVYGFPGSGKSYQFLKIAQFVYPQRCYVLDTDGSYERLMETEFSGLDNVVIYLVFDRDEWANAVEEVLANASNDDWVCIDRADVLWDATQDYYIQEVFGEDMADFFLRARKEMVENKDKKFVPLDGWKDWGVINKVYRSLWNRLTRPDVPFHLYVATSAVEVESNDDKLIKRTFNFLGVKPGGQKALAHGVHTVLYLDYVGKGDGWRVTTAKDRGRKYLDHQKLVSLPHQYLMAVAGWRRD